MQTATLIQATVKYAVDRIRQTKNGERVKAVVTPVGGGEDIELWDNPNGPVHYLKRGEQVTLTHDGRRYVLIATAPQSNGQRPPNAADGLGIGNGRTVPNSYQAQPTPGAIAAATPAVPGAREPHSADVREWLSIYEELKAALPGSSEQTWRAAACTLMMIRCRLKLDEF